MPANGFSIKALKFKLLAGEQKATECESQGSLAWGLAARRHGVCRPRWQRHQRDTGLHHARAHPDQRGVPPVHPVKGGGGGRVFVSLQTNILGLDSDSILFPPSLFSKTDLCFVSSYFCLFYYFFLWGSLKRRIPGKNGWKCPLET